ncbi:MAG: RidA family protein [Lentisphaeria bacterium]|nr:RidA family protein [Lentisphaeria bacterium]MDP7740441.1 RidA family protein [Lentisphaeria bacterium]
MPVARNVATDQAPAAIGPYSQAVTAGDFVFVSGQIPLDPATGEIVGDSIRPQAERVFDNLAAVLAAAGSSLDRAVKAEVFLKDMNDFAVLNEVCAERFAGDPLPARQAIEAVRLPKDVLVEISCIAVCG